MDEHEKMVSPRQFDHIRSFSEGQASVDSDGVMEIVLHARDYEGVGSSIHRVEGDKVIRILVAGWGV